MEHRIEEKAAAPSKPTCLGRCWQQASWPRQLRRDDSLSPSRDGESEAGTVTHGALFKSRWKPLRHAAIGLVMDEIEMEEASVRHASA